MKRAQRASNQARQTTADSGKNWLSLCLTLAKKNQTKIMGSCQSGRKVVTHDSKSDLPLSTYLAKILPDLVPVKPLEVVAGGSPVETDAAILEATEAADLADIGCPG